MGWGKNVKGCKTDHYNKATTRILTRILTYLGEVDDDYLTYMKDKLGLNGQQLKDGLRFLVNWGLIIKFTSNRKTYSRKYTSGMNYYKLNDNLNRLGVIK